MTAQNPPATYIELSINTTSSARTSQMPFMLVHRAEARLPIDFALGTSGSITLQCFALSIIELIK